MILLPLHAIGIYRGRVTQRNRDREIERRERRVEERTKGWRRNTERYTPGRWRGGGRERERGGGREREKEKKEEG